MSKILENLFLGSVNDAQRMTDVDLVINCTSHLPFYSHTARPVRISIEDNGDPDQYDELFNSIKNGTLFHFMNLYLENNETVLVHCLAGQQRSCGLVACFLIWKLHMNTSQAIAFIKQKRDVAFFGDVNFLDTIQKFENHITSKNAKHICVLHP